MPQYTDPTIATNAFFNTANNLQKLRDERQFNAMRQMQMDEQNAVNALRRNPATTPEQFARGGDTVTANALTGIANNQLGQQAKQQDARQAALANIAPLAAHALTIQDPAARKAYIKNAVPVFAEDFKAMGSNVQEGLGKIDAMPDQQLADMLSQVAQFAPAQPQQREFGQYQPGDYTTGSWANFLKTKDPSVLERYTTPRQEYAPSYQNVTRTNPDGSTQTGTFDSRTGAYNWNGPIVPAGKKEEAEASGRARGTIAGTREGKSGPVYNAFTVGMSQLGDALSKTETGPFAGRLPALTEAQQTAEGAQAIGAPVLKNLFRDAGEGTFTDADQALLLAMLPRRTDKEGARLAKFKMIDAVVKARLGIADTQEQPAQNAAQTPSRPQSASSDDDLLRKYGGL